MALGSFQEGDHKDEHKMVFAFHPQVSQDGGIRRVSTHKLAPVPQKPKVEVAKNTSPGKIVMAKATPNLKSSHKVIQVKNPGKFVHLVKKGDRLDKISMMYYNTHHRHKEIMRANPGLDPKKIRPGQKIVIPNIRGGLPQQTEVFIERDEPVVRDYIVKSGDVLGGISRKELGSSRYVNRILEVNPGLDPKKIKVGQVIRLPILDSKP